MGFKVFVLSIAILAGLLLAGHNTTAQSFHGWQASKYLDEIAGQPDIDLKTNNSTAVIVGKIIKEVTAVLGIIFLILILYAGYTWLTAGGSSEDVHSALTTIKWAIIGAIVVFGAYAITSYVVSNMEKAARPTIPYNSSENNNGSK